MKVPDDEHRQLQKIGCAQVKTVISTCASLRGDCHKNTLLKGILSEVQKMVQKGNPISCRTHIPLQRHEVRNFWWIQTHSLIVTFPVSKQ